MRFFLKVPFCRKVDLPFFFDYIAKHKAHSPYSETVSLNKLLDFCKVEMWQLYAQPWRISPSPLLKTNKICLEGCCAMTHLLPDIWYIRYLFNLCACVSFQFSVRLYCVLLSFLVALVPLLCSLGVGCKQSGAEQRKRCAGSNFVITQPSKGWIRLSS